jgi:hypothetical protein
MKTLTTTLLTLTTLRRELEKVWSDVKSKVEVL